MDTLEEGSNIRRSGSVWKLFFELPRPLRYGLVFIELFSLGLNVLQLALPLYSMQVFDRVLASGSTATLIALTVIVGFLLASGAVLDALRAQMLVRLSNILEAHWRDTLLKAAFRAGQLQPAGLVSLRD